MNLPPILICDEHIPVPSVFHSLYHEGPFRHCLICDAELIESDTQYVIERSFAGAEPVYEYAMCFNCCESLAEELSPESRQRIEAHFDERVDLFSRREELLEVSTQEVDPWIDRCLLTGRSREECRTRTIYGHCQGDSLLFSYLPYMISDAAMGEIAKLLSKKTQERLGDFTDQYLGMPPELLDQPGPPVSVF